MCQVAKVFCKINIYNNYSILVLKYLIQFVGLYVPYSFAKYYYYCFHLPELIVINKILFFSITFNLSDLQYLIIFCFDTIFLLLNDIMALTFEYAITTIKSIAIAIFFDETCQKIFHYPLAGKFVEGELLCPL